MKANELRIGNLINRVTENEETICIVKGIDDSGCYTEPLNQPKEHYYHANPIKSIEPIPLTEDILLKCGFVKDGDYFKKGVLDMFYCLKYYKHLNGYYFYIQYSDSPFEWDDNTFYPISCTYKYLHQLQNLHFALTGEELTIKL